MDAVVVAIVARTLHLSTEWQTGLRVGQQVTRNDDTRPKRDVDEKIDKFTQRVSCCAKQEG